MFLDDRELVLHLMERESRGPKPWLSLGTSCLFHLALAVLVLFVVRAGSAPEGETEVRVPVRLRSVPLDEAPAQYFELPERPPEPPAPEAVLSDADRRAHGGDPARPPAASPAEASGGVATPPSAPDSASVQPSPAEDAAARAAQDGAESAGSAPREATEAPSILALRRGGESADRAAAEEMAERRLEGLPQWPLVPAALPPSAPSSGGASAESDPEGGFVDEGGLSFDTKWFDWGPYGAEMVRRIKQNWRVPDLARVGMKGVVVIRFFILADGSIEEPRIVRSSGIPPFDHAAFQAIVDGAPFPRLPTDLGSAREGVTVSFYYNIRPPGRTGRGGADGASPPPRGSRD